MKKAALSIVLALGAIVSAIALQNQESSFAGDLPGKTEHHVSCAHCHKIIYNKMFTCGRCGGTVAEDCLRNRPRR